MGFQPVMCLVGLLTAVMGVISGCGFCLITHITDFDTIVFITPFLILSIGIDDTFIMNSSWRRSRRLQPTHRMAFTLSHSAVGITVTSLTDALSFGIGSITPVPAVRIFCAYTALSVMFAYLYQITFFVGILSLTARRESREWHCHGCHKVLSPVEAKDKGLCNMVWCCGLTKAAETKQDASEWRLLPRLIENYYTAVFFQPIVVALLLCWMLLYVGVSLYGCSLLEEGLQLTKMLPRDGEVNHWYRETQRYMWPYGESCVVYVLNSPDLTQRKNRERVMTFADKFVGSPHTIGRDGVLFWMEYYVEYLKEIGFSESLIQKEDNLWKDRLCFWLKHGRGRDAFERHVQFGPSNASSCGAVVSFRFVIGLKKYVTPNDHRDTAAFVRRTAASDPALQAYSYNFYWRFADQYAIIRPNTIQNVLIALAVMVVVAVLFIPNLMVACIIALAILSIDLGVIGTMYFWDIHLDALSMITIIMSIGFSVDLSAHICHAFIAHPGTPEERITLALTEVGVPVLQGAVSSILGVSMLATIDSYIVTVFYKIVMLNMLYGLLHALLVLPVTLVYSEKLCDLIRQRRNKVHVDTSPIETIHL